MSSFRNPCRMETGFSGAVRFYPTRKRFEISEIEYGDAQNVWHAYCPSCPLTPTIPRHVSSLVMC